MRICDFPGSRPIGAPLNWDPTRDGACSVLPVADAIDLQTSFAVMYSVWRPSADEIAALQNGGAIRLGVLGNQHPVVNMVVLTPESCIEAQLVEIGE